MIPASLYLFVYALVLGVAMPLLVAIVLRESWRKEVKTAVALLSCTLASLGLCFFQHRLDGTDLVTTIILVNTVSGGLFQNFWKPLGVANPLERVSDTLLFLTNLVQPRPPSAPPASSDETPTSPLT